MDAGDTSDDHVIGPDQSDVAPGHASAINRGFNHDISVPCPLLDEDHVAFVGGGHDDERDIVIIGIYAEIDGSLHKVIDTNDTLEGKALFTFDLHREGLDGSSVAFRANFADGTHALYRADWVAPE